jgi:hypothetical protein
MIGLSDCQRTKCGAKNFFMIPIYALLQNYYFSSVEDQSNFLDLSLVFFFPP